jgi:hypothetical protein
LHCAIRAGAGARTARVVHLARVMRWLAGMKDLVLLGVTVGFFAICWLYARSLDHL